MPVTSKVAPKTDTAIIDLRQPLDFQDFHLPGCINMAFVHEDTPSPFADPQVLDALWRKLEDSFKSPCKELEDLIRSKRILLLCYDGDSARVATSVLRAKGCEVDSVKGGFKALRRLREQSDSDVSADSEQQVIKGLPTPVTVTAQAV